MAKVNLIFCGGGNRQYSELAIKHGFLYGAQLPDTVYFDLHFADQDWKEPRRDAYVRSVADHRPYMATVLDWEEGVQLREVMSWADDIAPYVQEIIIIPKIAGSVKEIPLAHSGRPIRLGYSVPTRYGGTSVPIDEFGSRPVHLLGGMPHVQMRLLNQLNVISADGNVISKMASMRCQFWVPGTSPSKKSRWWPTLREMNVEVADTKEAPYVAFGLSCKNIMLAWKELG